MPGLSIVKSLNNNNIVNQSLNLIKNWRLNIDSNSNGLTDDWENSWLQGGTTAAFSIDGVQKIEITASPAAGIALTAFMPANYISVQSGQKYILELYTKVSGNVTSFIGADYFDSGKNYVDSIVGISISSAAYTRSYVAFTIPAAAAYITPKLIIVPDAVDNLGSGWYKNAVLRRTA